MSQGSWVRYPVWQHAFVSPSAFSRRAVVSYWQKYVHEVLVNRLGGLSLPRKSVVRLTDRPDMTSDVYRGRKTTMQCNKTRPCIRRTLWTEDSEANRNILNLQSLQNVEKKKSVLSTTLVCCFGFN